MIDMDELALKQEALRRAVEHERDKMQHGLSSMNSADVVNTAKAFEAYLRG